MIFKRRKMKSQTRIVRRSEPVVDVSPIRATLMATLATQRFEVNQGEFRGFGSPPGKF